MLKARKRNKIVGTEVLVEEYRAGALMSFFWEKPGHYSREVLVQMCSLNANHIHPMRYLHVCGLILSLTQSPESGSSLSDTVAVRGKKSWSSL